MRQQTEFPPDHHPSNILIVRFARLGDIILLFPAIKALRTRFPEAKIDFLVGHRCAPVLEVCDAISEVISVNRIAMRDGKKLRAIRDIWCLANEIRGRGYDLVIDFHSFRETNLLAWYSRAPYRLALKRMHGAYLPYCFNLGPVLEDKSKHVAVVFLSLLELLGIQCDRELDPQLDLRTEVLQEADLFLKNRDVKENVFLVGFNVGAGSPDRMWPWQNFAQLGRRISQCFNARIILFSGPGEEFISHQIADTMPEFSPLIARNLNLKEVAGLMQRCRLLVSNDTGPMHLGPAVGVPTLGLFSVGFPEHYRPLGPQSRFLKRAPIESLDVREVFQTATEMLLATGNP